MPEEWRIDERVGEPGTLHAGWPTTERSPNRRAVGVCRVRSSALVLGSTQPDSVVDRARADATGIAVVRRRSGGGAVLVTPDDPVWIDVWLPAGDPLWQPDVVGAFDWLGDVWVDALHRLGADGIVARHGPSAGGSPWSSLVCFGGIGSGEVVAADGSKVVGLAQRRTRHGAWFQGACVLSWDAAPLVRLLALPEARREAAEAALAGAVVGVADLVAGPTGGGGGRPTAASVIDALLRSLPR